MSLLKVNWNDKKDRSLYNELFYGNKKSEDLTEKEREFCTTMYHLEEFAAGLDG